MTFANLIVPAVEFPAEASIIHINSLEFSFHISKVKTVFTTYSIVAIKRENTCKVPNKVADLEESIQMKESLYLPCL